MKDLSSDTPESSSIKPDYYIPTYVINLKKRLDRLHHIKSQFLDRDEFDVHIIEACEDSNGKLGLWKSIVKIINIAINRGEDVILICEDDHLFTNNYRKEVLFENIIGAYAQNADILAGGVCRYGIAVPVASNRYWLDWFWSTQFIVIYKSFYERILSYKFMEGDATDEIISKLSGIKMTIFPFLSVQKDFGYSDVTENNNNRVDGIIGLFDSSSAKLERVHEVSTYFNYNKSKSY